MVWTESSPVAAIRREAPHSRLVFTLRRWAEALGFLWRNPLAPRNFAAGISRSSGRLELLVTDSPATGPLQALVTVLAAERVSDLTPRVKDAIQQVSEASVHAVVGVGVARASGYLAGAWREAGRVAPIYSLRLLGPGLPEFAIGARPGILPWRLPATAAEQQCWSRSMGALGEAGWRRLTSLRTVIVGCGRSGSLMATALARLGVRRLTLVDPDRLELHNLGEMDVVRAAQRGDFKVYAVAEELERLQEGIGAQAAPRLKVEPIAEPVSSLRALEAARRADLLITCVDDEAARLAAAVLARLYLKPLLDIGTGVFEAAGNRRQMGADIRLVMPEECLLCVGGLNDLAVAQARLIAGQDVVTVEDWRRQRAGSLRSLNMLAVGLGVRLIEELVAGRLGESAWVRVEFDRGLPHVERLDATRQPDCPLCRFGGWGDEGLRLGLETLLDRRAAVR